MSPASQAEENGWGAEDRVEPTDSLLGISAASRSDTVACRCKRYQVPLSECVPSFESACLRPLLMDRTVSDTNPAKKSCRVAMTLMNRVAR
jgi:hypothetical protein